MPRKANKKTDAEPELIRCQQCLGALTKQKTAWQCEACGLTYPVREGLLFMGYDRAEKSFIELTMEEERVHQGTPETLEQDLEYLRHSAPRTVSAINLLERYADKSLGNELLDIGSGSGWVGWLLAQAGYDPWLMDFEANSVALGKLYEHPDLEHDKRIVGDAKLLPFADQSFPLAVCKEFAHHVPQKEELFDEMNRILMLGGTLLLTDPYTTVWSWWHYRNSMQEDHAGHSFIWERQYMRLAARSGFEVVWRGRSYPDTGGRLGVVSKVKERAHETLKSGDKARRGPIGWLYDHTAGGGGEMVVLLRKRSHVSRRPKVQIEVTKPETLVVTDEDAQKFSPLAGVLADSAKELTPLR